MAATPAPVNPHDSKQVLAGGRARRHVAKMTSSNKQLEERLAAALRENLKRRKAQSRAEDRSIKDHKDDSLKS